jgi:aminoglycoside phosphotransferase family enzyme/predicted kinase
MSGAARVVETHVSTLFFVDGLVYKRKKAVDLGFADFRTREARQAACEQEVRLNRRMAPDVYLGVADVLGVDGTPCDHLVVMRELPASARLATLVSQGADVDAALEQVAGQLAALHRRSPAPADLREVASTEGLQRLWELGTAALEQHPEAVAPEVVARTRALALRWLAGRAELLRSRQDRVVDGHGDLLADDTYLLEDGPRVLDCLEFDERLRVGDGLMDAAFLAMDLERLGAPAAGRRFLDDYRSALADDAPAGLEDVYLAYRAHVRCKVSCLQGAQQPGAARQLADLALAHLERARVRLVLVGGLPGSGKTTLAARLAAEHGWLHLSSDVVRRAARIPLKDRYSAATTDLVYADLAARARVALAQGRSVVLDASFADAHRRDEARRVAGQACVDVVEVRCVVPAEVADQRITRRPPGPSEATPAVRAALAARADPWPQARAVDTSGEVEQSLAAVDRVTCPAGHDDRLLPAFPGVAAVQGLTS